MSHPLCYNRLMIIETDKMNNVENWYEVRVDGEKVAAFAPISRGALASAFKVIEVTRLDLYRGKQMQIVARYEDSSYVAHRPRRRSEVIHEENPTVIEVEETP